MEAKPPGIEKSKLKIWSSDEDHHLQNSIGHVKSYTCAFCKRGFSNAQALGGHMNIHRKDRAKLRQFAEENLLSLDITKANPIEPPDASEAKSTSDQNISESSHEDKSCTPKRPCTVSREDDKVEELQQLPFFAETPSASGDHIKASSSCNEDINKEKRIPVELDLELRLGPEPDHETSVTITKEYFY